MASTYLYRTFGTPTNNKKWTYSYWIKLAGVSDKSFLSCGSSTATRGIIYHNNGGNGTIEWLEQKSSSTTSYLVTNQVFRDVNGWYHFVFNQDSTQATASDRIKMYVNGEQVTSFSTSTYPSQNYDSVINSAIRHDISGRNNHSSSDFYIDGSMAHVHFIDGTAYDASTFGETDSTSGIWKPKTSPSVTYGTNGFFLKFQDSSSLGDDSSGNTNDFTLSGNGRQILDTPTNVFATLNPLDINPASAGDTFSNGNTTLATNNNSNAAGSRSTLAVSSGKWYCEVKYVSNTAWNGVMATDTAITGGMTTGTITWYQGRTLYVDGSNTANWGSALSAGDIQGIALDMDNNRVTISQGGQWWGGSSFNQSQPHTFQNLTSGYDTWSFLCRSGSGTATSSWNFGNGYFGTTAVSSAENDDAGYGKFEYDVPTGYYALCTKNINTYG